MTQVSSVDCELAVGEPTGMAVRLGSGAAGAWLVWLRCLSC